MVESRLPVARLRRVARRGIHLQFTVAITVYKTPHFLPHAIQTVLAQTLRDWEILVYSDGRSRETAGTVAQLQADLQAANNKLSEANKERVAAQEKLKKETDAMLEQLKRAQNDSARNIKVRVALHAKATCASCCLVLCTCLFVLRTYDMASYPPRFRFAE